MDWVTVALMVAGFVAATGVGYVLWRLDIRFERHVNQALEVGRHPSTRACACGRLTPDLEPTRHGPATCPPVRELL